ncbi:MAG: PAS domain-containing protein [Acidimicrobiia bacterium]|nr:PAS domain-containing protein [Acidimicrobiia bacterium]
MAQQPIELILLKQWATHIATPVWIMDVEGNLVFYNEPAEVILGKRFDEAGELHADQLADLFVTTGLDGEPVANKELPVVVALTEHHPAHAELRIQTLDTGESRRIEVTAIPIEGQGGRSLGAFAVFWESASK